MKYLCTVTETYRVDTETEATNLIEEAKKDGRFILSKSSTEYKERKQKGEIIETYYKVTLTKTFNDIKEPISEVNIIYEVHNEY